MDVTFNSISDTEIFTFRRSEPAEPQSCKSRFVAEMKRPLLEITLSPTTVVLSVYLAACHPFHYHRGPICTANGILHTHVYSILLQICKLNIWPRWECSSESTFGIKHMPTDTLHPNAHSFHHIAVFWPEYIITWLECVPLCVRVCVCARYFSCWQEKGRRSK